MDDKVTATTADLTMVAGNALDSDLELEEKADFAAENKPRPPPAEILYGGQGMLMLERWATTQVGDEQAAGSESNRAALSNALHAEWG
mmetsp:Transcript_35622/g.65944  ORF Transcript_35622/g.65944 Transcript_35622/m.65944 type:complete len:88 (+) Transcript_35622:336-599(+)